ncbi:MAG: hybrid sensor histidine kinase/response regulator, partial [Spirochaetaceae bacterium]|nr:hybrid sensor histidine kinase/response regulator [Spirochaetaceae bacterium]
MRLRQILSNLLSNAVKFTEKGNITLNISHENGSDGIPRLSFSVIDTGIGIPEEKIDTIFSSFEQADTSISRKYGGTGL